VPQDDRVPGLVLELVLHALLEDVHALALAPPVHGEADLEGSAASSFQK
jgi:hypothetical protein